MATKVVGNIKWVGPTIDDLAPQQKAVVAGELSRLLADALVAEYRKRHTAPAVGDEAPTPPPSPPDKATATAGSVNALKPWLTAREAAARA